MATRRRHRRAAADPDLSADATQRPQTPTGTAVSTPRLPFSAALLALLLILSSLLASLAVYRSARRPGPLLSVHERGLVKPTPTYQEILSENSRVADNRSRRHFVNPVLAYITPWNSKGYEMAKMFSSKLTHLSPVWYELKNEGKKLTLEGRHNADMGWISQVRMSRNSLVLPRVVLEAFPGELLQKKKQWRKAIDLIVTECKDLGYDGIVLESWSRWAAYGVLHDPDMRSMGLQFIKQLGLGLHSVGSKSNASHHLELVYVIPAPQSQILGENDFGLHDLQQLSDVVDGFSLMTYDFSGPQSPGPNAPLKWIHSSMHLLLGGDGSDARGHAHKIFLGINFYGNDFVLAEGRGGGAITGRDYVSLLEKHRPTLQWEERSAEHFFVYSYNNVKHVVFYPSLMSISMRLDEARAWGAGISIWEIGQGLDYFFDIL